MSGRKLYYCIDESEALEFDGASFVRVDTKRAKRGFCGAVVAPEHIRSHTFKIPPETEGERLDTLVEITMFESGGLDLEKEYAIAYVKHPLEYDSSMLIEAFAVERSRLTQTYGGVARKTGHIDLLAVPYTVYEGLYAYDRADRGRVELFLYLGDGSSYAVLCKDGRYIAHRDLLSISSIAAEANISVEALKDTLRKRGLESRLYGPDELLLIETVQRAFSSIVERVAQTVNHKRGVFSIKSVDRLYLDFEQSLIPGLWELFDSYGFEESEKSELVCCESLEPQMQHTGVEALYMLAVRDRKVEPVNLTIFEKRESFFRTHTGRFVAAVAAAALLSGGYALIKERELAELQSEGVQLKAKLNDAKKRVAVMRKALAKERSELERVLKKVERGRREIMAFDETADAALLIEESKRYRRKMVEDVDRALAKYRLSAASLEQNGSKVIEVEIVSEYSRRDRIAKFMKSLIDEGYRSVGTGEIKLDENLYSSRVEIVR
ncbi:hypothetical protein NNO_0213 [Hydrogenimonas sp.]|nr:hypothetical protein NNO_0213 [Hydrogenimonas sp.]